MRIGESVQTGILPVLLGAGMSILLWHIENARRPGGYGGGDGGGGQGTEIKK